jgi:hypothetical protein
MKDQAVFALVLHVLSIAALGYAITLLSYDPTHVVFCSIAALIIAACGFGVGVACTDREP